MGGSVKYLRTRASAVKYFPLGSGDFVFSTIVEGGYIHSFEDSPGPGRDPVRLIDRFFLGESQLRGFDIRGVGLDRKSVVSGSSVSVRLDFCVSRILKKKKKQNQ